VSQKFQLLKKSEPDASNCLVQELVALVGWVPAAVVVDAGFLEAEVVLVAGEVEAPPVVVLVIELVCVALPAEGPLDAGLVLTVWSPPGVFKTH